MARLFVAIGLPDATRKSLSKLLPGGVPSLCKAPAERLHLTLRFIGQADESIVAETLGEVSMPENLILKIRGTGLFGSEQHPKVLWAGIEAAPELIELQRTIENRLFDSGFARESRPWKPHISLARVRHSRALSATERQRRDRTIARFLNVENPTEFPELSVDTFTLYASETLAGMLHYREAKRFSSPARVTVASA